MNNKTTEEDIVTIRTRPDRVLLYPFDVLSAEVARQCIEEWAGWRQDSRGDRRGACERMAILVDLGRQQSAIILERHTGVPATPWSVKANRAKWTNELYAATRDNPEHMADSTIRRCRREVERPWFQWYRENGSDPR